MSEYIYYPRHEPIIIERAETYEKIEAPIVTPSGNSTLKQSFNFITTASGWPLRLVIRSRWDTRPEEIEMVDLLIDDMTMQALVEAYKRLRRHYEDGDQIDKVLS